MKLRRPGPDSWKVLRPTMLASLVPPLVLGAISSFWAAYHLISRYDSSLFASHRTHNPHSHYPDSYIIDVGLPPLALYLPHSPSTPTPPPPPSHPKLDPSKSYLSYLPHSGFHNQRIALENALTLSALLNLTLIVPPVRLGARPLTYAKFGILEAWWRGAGKEGLAHCGAFAGGEVGLPPECLDYFDYTYAAWDWLVDLEHLVSAASAIPGINRISWLGWPDTDYHWLHGGDIDLSSGVGIGGSWETTQDGRTAVLKDTTAYEFRFVDYELQGMNPHNTTSTHPRYTTDIPIESLLAHFSPSSSLSPNSSSQSDPSNPRTPQILQLSSLFGSSRLHLTSAPHLALQRAIRESMTFGDASGGGAILGGMVGEVVGALGMVGGSGDLEWSGDERGAGAETESRDGGEDGEGRKPKQIKGAGTYLGAHLRLGDGKFKSVGRETVREVWYGLVVREMGVSFAEAGRLERILLGGDGEGRRGSEGEEGLEPMMERDVPRHKEPVPPGFRPPFPHPITLPLPTSTYSNATTKCRRPLHTHSSLQGFNIPLYISTDARSPAQDPTFELLLRTWPCTFFLDDFLPSSPSPSLSHSLPFNVPLPSPLQPKITFPHLSSLPRLTSTYDHTPLQPPLLPLLDALITSHAWGVVGTDGSTFSTYLEGVLWRGAWGMRAVGRGGGG